MFWRLLNKIEVIGNRPSISAREKVDVVAFDIWRAYVNVIDALLQNAIIGRD